MNPGFGEDSERMNAVMAQHYCCAYRPSQRASPPSRPPNLPPDTTSACSLSIIAGRAGTKVVLDDSISSMKCASS